MVIPYNQIKKIDLSSKRVFISFLLYYLVPKCQVHFRRTVHNPIEYNYGPRSVAIGDFNNDTWLDMIVANSVVNHIAIFLWNSNGSYSDPVKYPTGSFSNPYTVAVGYLNNDSRLDIAVSNFGTNNVGIFLAFSNGSFASQIELSTAIFRPLTICLADFDNDTLLDIATANYGSDSIAIFYGYGNGSFSHPTTYSTGYDSFPFFLIARDFNDDSHLDLAIANYGTSNIGILFGNANRTFSNQVIFPASSGSHPSSIAAGYFNDDMFLDITVALSRTNEIGVLLNNGNGTFSNRRIYSLENASPYSINVADLNGDKHVDLFIANRGINNSGVFLGYGNGSFVLSKMYSSGSVSSISIAVDDLNKDNRADAIVLSNDTGAIDILLGVYEGFSNQIRYSAGSWAYSVAVGDFNNDTRLDIVVANWGNNVSVLLGYGDGTFQNQTTYSTGSSPQSVAVGDFNNDTRIDIVAANSASNDVSVLFQYNRGALQRNRTYASSGGSRLQCVAIADANNDSSLDLFVANYGTSNIGVLLGYGNGDFATQTMLNTGSNSHSSAITLADFDRDSHLDIASSNQIRKLIDVLRGNGDGTFVNQINNGNDSLFRPSAIAHGDFNNDKRSEIVVAYEGGDRVDIQVAHNTGSYRNQRRYLAGSEPQSVAVGDFNNDTRLDIVVANGKSSDVSVLLGYGDGTFQDQTTYSTGSSPRSVAVGDFNNDTRLDIVVANYYSNDVSVLLGYGDGTFQNQRTYSTGSYPTSVAVGDFNNDTLLDIVVANAGSRVPAPNSDR